MDAASFASSAIGELVRIQGVDQYLGRHYDHVAFSPLPLPIDLTLESRTYRMASEADRAIGRLDAAVMRLPNPKLLLRPALRREAVSTSALEGTYATLLEVFEADYLEDRQRTAEQREVLNYVRAAERGIDLIEQKPICVTVISELQSILVRGTRTDGATAGRIRTGQVYIGERERGIEHARFVPPPAGEILERGIYAWEAWLNAEDDIPLLIKAALAHYQFETLHPYTDGNGRLGRLIVALQFVASGALRLPILNLSPWLKRREDQYKSLLLSTSQTGDFNPWAQFFVAAVAEQAEDAVRRIDALQALKAQMLARLREVRAKGVVLEVVEDLIGYPVITISEVASLHGVTFPPAAAAIQRLVDLGYLNELTGRQYGRVFGCTGVMQLLDQF
jgi:Fic family protein